jgi:hypothetical protein
MKIGFLIRIEVTSGFICRLGLKSAFIHENLRLNALFRLAG